MAKLSKKISNMSARVGPSQRASVLSPLRHSVFRALWIASVVSNIGSWMQDVGESWLMRIESEPRDGPAITSIEYRIDPTTAEKFLEALKDLRRIRLRDGAIRWNVLRDSADPERYLEVFVTESWGEHLRQHERITADDRKIEQRVQAFHVEPQPPQTTHLIAEELPK